MDNTKIENTIQELANIQSQCQELIDRIREIEKEIELDSSPKFERVENGEVYYRIMIRYGIADFDQSFECHEEIDEARFNSNNYFKTAERAKEVTDKINFLLRLERLHDTFCPDYVPEWNNVEETFAIYYDHMKKRYEIQSYDYMRYPTNVYFPSAEIAQKVCDILNNELEDNNYEN